MVVEDGEETEKNNKRTTALKTNEGERTLNEQWRWWDALSPELLALIFVRVKPVDAMLRAIPLVCWSWREAVAGPDCWAHIDLEQWCRRVDKTAAIDSAVRRLVRRSRGTLKTLSAYKISDAGFFYACSAGSFLRALKMPMSEVTDEMVEKHAGALSMLTVLDISYCIKITSKGIEVLGKSCKALVELRRNMPPPSYEFSQDNGAGADESEAMAVANTMCSIEHLELAYGRFSDHGLDAILSNCGSLHALDIRGCWNVELDGNTGSKCDLIQSFSCPWENDHEDDRDDLDDEGDDQDEDGDDSDAGLVDVDSCDDDPDDDGYD